MKTTSLTFVAHPEKGQVSALLHLPPRAKCLVVFGHGAGAGMRHANIEGIAEALAAKSIGTLRYQFPFMERGGGRDSGEVSLQTVRSAIELARQHAGSMPIIAGGHSFGGRMTSMAAADEPLAGVSGLVFCSYPLHMHGKPSVARAAHLPDIKVPMLFLSGTRDKMMSHDLLQPTLKKLDNRVTFRWLDTADHGYKVLKRSRTCELDVYHEIATEIDNWFERSMASEST